MKFFILSSPIHVPVIFPDSECEHVDIAQRRSDCGLVAPYFKGNGNAFVESELATQCTVDLQKCSEGSEKGVLVSGSVYGNHVSLNRHWNLRRP